MSEAFSGLHYLGWCAVVHLGSGGRHANVSPIRNAYENLIILCVCGPGKPYIVGTK